MITIIHKDKVIDVIVSPGITTAQAIKLLEDSVEAVKDNVNANKCLEIANKILK